MQTVVLDGVTYTKATKLAKQFGYTADYLGQLCRAKKIDAQIVGRSWFVNADSLAAYKESVNAQWTEQSLPKTDFTSRLADKTNETKAYRVKVNAPLKNKTAKLTRTLTPSAAPASAVQAVSVNKNISYLNDEDQLFPQLNKQSSRTTELTQAPETTAKPQTNRRYLQVKLTEAKKLKIKPSKKKKTAFSTTKMPEVALSGKLAVSDYPSEESDISKPKEQKSTDLQTKFRTDLEPTTKSGAKNTTKTAKAPKTRDRTTKMARRDRNSISNETDINLKSVSSQGDNRVSRKTSKLLRGATWLVLLATVIVSVAMLSLSAEVLVFDQQSTSDLTFSWQQFLEIFAYRF